MINSREMLLNIVINDSQDWASVVDALCDGHYLATISGAPGIPEHIVEDAHEHAVYMAETHPDYKF